MAAVHLERCAQMLVYFECRANSLADKLNEGMRERKELLPSIIE